MGTPEIEHELDQILASPFFKGSKRSQAFLKYVVAAACSEGSDCLKERTLGIALFGRAPDYDTGSDAIVRVKANEVRKRLSQYNLANPKNAVIITLETGSYVPQIVRNAGQEEPPSQATAPGSRFAAMSTVAALCAVVFLIAVVALYQISFSSPIKKFWSPFLDHGSTIICIASPPVYVTNRTTLPAVGSFAWGHETVHQADLVVTPDSFLDVGDASAAFHIEELLQTLGRRSHVDIPDNVSFAELKEAPVVLIGGPQYNSWTRTMVTNDLPFVFVQDDQGVRIVDREHPARFWGDPGVLPIDVTLKHGSISMNDHRLLMLNGKLNIHLCGRIDCKRDAGTFGDRESRFFHPDIVLAGGQRGDVIDSGVACLCYPLHACGHIRDSNRGAGNGVSFPVGNPSGQPSRLRMQSCRESDEQKDYKTTNTDRSFH